MLGTNQGNILSFAPVALDLINLPVCTPTIIAANFLILPIYCLPTV
jgi:hypothetical protein